MLKRLQIRPVFIHLPGEEKTNMVTLNSEMLFAVDAVKKLNSTAGEQMREHNANTDADQNHPTHDFHPFSKLISELMTKK